MDLVEDLLCFSRVLNLVSHYEAGMDYHLESLLKSTYKFLIKMNDLHEVQKEMIKFIKGLQDIYPHELNNIPKNFRKKWMNIWILNFSNAIFALTKFKHLLKCYQERWRD